MTVRYFAKNVYGINRFYVNNQGQEKAIKMITGNKTLTFDAIQGLQMLGIKFQQVLDPALDVFEFEPRDTPPAYPCSNSIDSIQ